MAAKKRTGKSKIKRALARAKEALRRVSKKKPARKKAAKRTTEPTKKKKKKTPARLGHRPIAPRPKNKATAKRAPSGKLVPGAKVPSFSLLDDKGQLFSSHVLEGSRYVIYFYPKDDTPGCTKEACGFRDSLADFAKTGVRVIGVSPDSPGTHARFKDKYDLPFTLLSDADRKLAQQFGVWVKKQNYGREYMGVERSTFFVGPDGRVLEAWRGVKVPGHVEKVLERARLRD